MSNEVTEMEILKALFRCEITSLLARVTYRILTRQKLPHSSQHSLDVLPKEVLTVSRGVNTNGEQGDA
ncbi:MAG: hypothetical protein JNJ77_03660 [Planctomycetia bacterium]|nr:hypothetical protein [Planctomycetia bacterium]